MDKDIRILANSLLSTTTVDTDIGTKQALFTVPVDKHCVPTAVVIRNASASLETIGDSLTFGFGVGASEWGSIFQLLADLTVPSRGFGLSAFSTPGEDLSIYTRDPFFIIGAAGDVFGCIFNDPSIDATLVIDVFGYLY